MAGTHPDDQTFPRGYPSPVPFSPKNVNWEALSKDEREIVVGGKGEIPVRVTARNLLLKTHSIRQWNTRHSDSEQYTLKINPSLLGLRETQLAVIPSEIRLLLDCYHHDL